MFYNLKKCCKSQFFQIFFFFTFPFCLKGLDILLKKPDVKIQALIQSLSIEETKQTTRERWENCINLY